MILAAALINFVESVHDGIVPPPDSLEFYSEFKAECEKVGINLRDESLVNLEINDEPETLTFEYLLQFPFEIEEADVESSLGDWSVGFVDAMFLNEDAWFTPEFEEQLVDLTLPIMVFSGIDEEDPQMETFRRNGQLMDELAEEIPENLNELYLMYHTPA
jgi:yecA family protein